jgi:predicted ATPase/class 3 adenylate cyclase
MVATSPEVTFLFTDIEGSTRLWESDPARMARALERHDRLCRVTISACGGRLVKMSGDGLHAVFTDSTTALATVLELQQGMAAIAADCGIAFRMRCGLHVGVAQVRDDDYFGSAVNRAARIMAAAHGGQVLLSQAVVDASKGGLPDGTDLLSLGRVRLRDLADPEDIWQLTHGGLDRAFPALRSLDSTPNNLPRQLTSFIGRENEISEVEKLLDHTQLLTLTGAGGSGKTRLAIQMAADILDAYADGVWLVELAALSDPGLVPQTVATVMGLKEQAGKTLTQTLIEHLAAKRLLLMLDNAEHVLAACGQLAGALIHACPQMVVLATSREALGIPGELTFRVPSLSTPDPKRDVTPEQLSSFESVRLFVERAQFNMPRFAVTAQNAPALASVCHRLDGIPLAIELAAARVRAMSMEQLDQRLDQRFHLITGGSRMAPRRQQTLRALIDWSYDLLDPAEMAMLCRLSAFAGGWTLEAAEHVCAGEGVEDWKALDLLTSLADKNLVGTANWGDETRYRLLETVRQYAQEKLMESGANEPVRVRHRDYFLAVAEEAEPKLVSAEQVQWLQRLEAEHDNLRAALEWSLVATGTVGGLRLCSALQVFWVTRGHLSEGRGWCARVLGKGGAKAQTQERAKALTSAGALAYFQSDFPAARELAQECLAIWRELGDRKGIAVSLSRLGVLALEQGDFASAQALNEESLAIKQELGDRSGIAASLNNLGNLAFERGDFASAQARYEESLAITRGLGDRVGAANALNNLGTVATEQGDFASARAMHEECLAIRRELENRGGIAISLNNLGTVTFEQGEFASARAMHEESLAIMRELGDRRAIAFSLDELAAVFAAFGNSLHAARVWGAAERLREEIGSPLPPIDRPRYDRRVAVARAGLGDDAAFDRAQQEGRALTFEQAIELAIGETK